MFNDNLKRIRLKSGLSQKQLAEYLSISSQSVSKWETGEALPSIAFLPDLAKCLNCEINDFFEHEEHKYNTEEIKQFLALLVEYKTAISKSDIDIECPELLKMYSDKKDILAEFCQDIIKQKIINLNKMQGILNCSREDAKIILNGFIKLELIEELDDNGSYYVIKSEFGILDTILRLKIKTDKLDKEMQKFKQKIEIAHNQ